MDLSYTQALLANSKKREDYSAAVYEFDSAISEAMAVSQGCAERLPLPHVSYGTHIFTRMCAHGTSIIRAVPRSRWVSSEFEDWNFSCIAPHARALLEGYLFFAYLMDEPSSEAEWKARVGVMQLNDCTRRLELMSKIEDGKNQVRWFASQQAELIERLEANEYFQNLPKNARQEIAKGQKPWMKSREQLLALVEFPKSEFDALWLLYSQHSHILPLSFYRMEPNGRGTGIENETDRIYIASALLLGAEILSKATGMMVFQFPDTEPLRKGVASVFAPGPTENLPRWTEANSLTLFEVDLTQTDLYRNISSYMRVIRRAVQ